MISVKKFSRNEYSWQYEIFLLDFRATLTIQTWLGWSDFFTYTIKGELVGLKNDFDRIGVLSGYTKAVLKLLSSDELVRQYMLQVALYIAAHYGNVDLVSFFFGRI